MSLHKVLEIREGQLTRKFDQFPYEEVEEQSFSLIMEEMTKRYVRLTSLDLICDSPESYNDWIHEVSWSRPSLYIIINYIYHRVGRLYK